MPDCLPLNCEKKTSKSSSKNNSRTSDSLLNQSYSSTQSQKLKSKNIMPWKADSNSISTAGSDSIEVIKFPKKRATESMQSLATLGRAYGNNISKQNILKTSRRPQSTHDIREPWHTSSKTESREYGDYFSWQSGLTFLETHRISIIRSKGIKHFFEDYMKKLQRCHIFERGHNVQPFASIRFELLNKVHDAKNSRASVCCESIDSVGVDKSHDSIHKTFKNKVGVGVTKTENLSAPALKTIELLRKFKQGKSIEADLQRSKTSGLDINKSSSGQQHDNRSGSTSNQKLLTKQSSSDTRTSDGIKPKETDQQLQNLEAKSSTKSITLSFGINQDLMKNLQLPEPKASISQRSNSLNSQSSFLQNRYLLPSENSVSLNERLNRYFPSKRRDSRVSDIKEIEHSVETLYRSEGLLEDVNIQPNVNRRKSK